MSRSYRHTPVMGNAGTRSEQWDKAHGQRKLRMRVRQWLRHRRWSALPTPGLRQVSDVWGFAKDGKHWFDARGRLKDLRK